MLLDNRLVRVGGGGDELFAEILNGFAGFKGL